MTRLTRSLGKSKAAPPDAEFMIRFSRRTVSLAILALSITAAGIFAVLTLKSHSVANHVPAARPAATSSPVEQWLSAANANDPEAQCNVGNFYWSQVPANNVEAVKWYRKAAEQGNAHGECCLGVCYYNGEGVEKDLEKARELFAKAAAQGWTGAEGLLVSCYYNGDGGEQDYFQAAKWFRRAAEKGNAFAQQDLVNCFAHGFGVEQNSFAAVKWFRKAGLQGNDLAELSLGWCYAQGSGVQSDPMQSYKWFRLALKQKSGGGDEQYKAEIAQVRQQLSPNQIENSERWVAAFVPGPPVREPPSESTEVISFTNPPDLDPNWLSFQSMFEVKVYRILKGDRVVEEGKLYPTQVDDPQKEPVYFEVAVKNIDCRYDADIYGVNFKLIDGDGYSYSDILPPHDYIRGKISIGTTVRGGIAFLINKSARPKTLIFDTGFLRSFGLLADVPAPTASDEYNRAAAVGAGTKVCGEATLRHVSLFQTSPAN